MTDDQSQIPNPKPGILKRVWRLGTRLDLTAALIFIVLALAALGSCFPQLSPLTAADPERLAQWETAVRMRYGALADVLAASGVFRLFRSPVFLLPLALLAAATLVCTLNRWRAVWRQVFYRSVQCPDATFDAAPYTAELPSPLRGGAQGGVALVRVRLEQHGFRVTTNQQTNQQTIHLRGDRNRLSPLATLVTHLAVLLLLLGAVWSSVYGWREEVAVGPGETVAVGHANGLALRNDGFAILRYPDGSAAGYEAEVAVIRLDQEVVRARVRVNEPLTYGSIRFALHGYSGTEGSISVTLLAAHDPGYGVVIAAGLLLLLGLIVSFNFPHCCVHARIGPEGVLRLAGRADRQAWDFGREFGGLVGEIRHAVESER